MVTYLTAVKKEGNTMIEKYLEYWYGNVAY